MNDFTLGTMYWINPKLTAAEVEDDFCRMRDNGLTLVRCIVWWELVEKIEGQYDFIHVDRFFAAAEKTGVDVMVTIGFYLPFWLTAKLDAIGKNDPGRYPSLEHPEIKVPLSRLIETLVNRYRHSSALKYWNLWNEPTLNTTKNHPMLEKFAAYLKKRYCTIEALREAWRGEYPVFSFLCPPNLDALTADWIGEAFRLGDRGRSATMAFDWYRFLTTALNDQLRWIHEEVKRHDPIHPTHTNLSSILHNPCYGGRAPFELARIPDSISFSMHVSNDYLPGIEVCDRFMNFSCAVEQAYSWTHGEAPTMVGEIQAGTTYCHHCQYTPTPLDLRKEFWRSVAAGMDGMIYWQWQAWRAGTFELGDFGLRAPDDGAPTDRSREVEAFASLYRENREIFAAAKRQTAKIAILVSADTLISKMLFQLDHPSVSGYAHDANFALFGCFRALEAANLVSEFISEEQIEAGELKRYDVLYLPGVEVMRQMVADKICEFVARGGNAYADGRTAYLDEHMYLRNRIPGHHLPELFGAKEADFIALQGRAVITATDGSQAGGLSMAQRLKLLGGEVSAFFSDGSIVAADNRYGQGRTRLVGAQLCRALREYNDANTLRYVASFARECGVKPVIDAPLQVTCRCLEGNTHDVLMVFNNTGHPVELALPVRGKSIRSLYHQCKFDTSTLSCAIKENAMDIFFIHK